MAASDDHPPRPRLSEVVLDAADAHELADFYARLLAEPIAVDEPDWVVIRPPGSPSLAFATEPGYAAPVWPTSSGQQQMMLHLDFEVDDLGAGVAHAVACGATLATHQPQEHVRVLLDPAGHPFCLWAETPP